MKQKKKKKSSVLKSQSTFCINENEPLHFASAIKPSIIMCEPLPALCKSHRSNIKPCFHFLLQSYGIIRGYAIWRSLLITPVARQWTRCYPHMLSQLLYLHCGLPLWNNDFRIVHFWWGERISETHNCLIFSVRQMQWRVKVLKKTANIYV